jgi:hypothetical protein
MTMARYVESIGPVGTWYAATSERAACLESVLHDVPLDPPGVFSLADLAHYRIPSWREARAELNELPLASERWIEIDTS